MATLQKRYNGSTVCLSMLTLTQTPRWHGGRLADPGRADQDLWL